MRHHFRCAGDPSLTTAFEQDEVVRYFVVFRRRMSDFRMPARVRHNEDNLRLRKDLACTS